MEIRGELNYTKLGPSRVISTDKGQVIGPTFLKTSISIPLKVILGRWFFQDGVPDPEIHSVWAIKITKKQKA